jgi:hypothetical protein
MNAPIACLLMPDALRARQDQLLPGLVRRAASVVLRGDELEMRFAAAPGLIAQIAQVVDAERQCCRFLTFDLKVEASNGPITLRVSGPPGTGAVLQDLTGRPTAS